MEQKKEIQQKTLVLVQIDPSLIPSYYPDSNVGVKSNYSHCFLLKIKAWVLFSFCSILICHMNASHKITKVPFDPLQVSIPPGAMKKVYVITHP